ncbi:hypothetical protein EV2_006103 [Malus domestica]
MLENREKGRRHRPKRRRRDTPPVPGTDSPRQESVGHDQARRRLEPIHEPLERGLHLRHDGVDEAIHVGGADQLRRDDVGNRGESNVVRGGFGTDEAEPFLRDDEGDEDVRLL